MSQSFRNFLHHGKCGPEVNESTISLLSCYGIVNKKTLLLFC
jgi:hypothetical protein